MRGGVLPHRCQEHGRGDSGSLKDPAGARRERRGPASQGAVRMIKIILLVVVAFVAAILLFALTRPNSLHVERAASIKAPPDRIFPLINDFRNWASWSPYEKRDPVLKRAFSDPSSGKGAVYDWSG